MTNNDQLILVVEDELEIRELIALQLQRKGYLVTTCASAEEGFRLLQHSPYNLVVLDWMLPGRDGVSLVREIRKGGINQRTPVLMVTAKVEPEDIVLGLENGADDYVTKPFEVSVLLARVQALLRRTLLDSDGDRDPLAGNSIEVGPLSLDLDRYIVRCDGEEIGLTRSEFKLLKALILKGGGVLTRDQLIAEVQGDGVAVVGRTVDTHVFGLRKKLGTCADSIETVRGIGYRIKS